MKCFCHIGNPKAFSTSIQSFLELNKNNKYDYFGFNPNVEFDKWYNLNFISELLDKDLRFTSNYHFHKKKNQLREKFLKEIQASKSNNLDIFISSETISSRYLIEDIDISEKFSRLQYLVPAETSFILFFRNIYESLISLYKEFVNQRYSFEFDFFCNELIISHECNLLISFFPNIILNYLNDLLINNNSLHAVFIDNNKSLSDQIVNSLNEITNFDFESNLPHFNSSIKRINTFKNLDFNKTQKHKIFYTGLIENHRAFRTINKSSNNDYLFKKLNYKRKFKNNNNIDKKNYEFNFNNNIIKYINNQNTQSLLDSKITTFGNINNIFKYPFNINTNQ